LEGWPFDVNLGTPVTVRSGPIQSTKNHYNVPQRAGASLSEILDFEKKRAAASQPAIPCQLLTVVKPYAGSSMMCKAATLVLFVLTALAVAAAQTSAGTSNTPATTPQTQNPSSVGPAAGTGTSAPRPGTSAADIPQGANTAVVDEVGAGTEIHAALDTPLSSKISRPGDRFTATVSDSVRANNGAVVIPSGARVEGEVAESEDSKTLAALKDKPKLSLRFRDVVLPTGQTLPLSATLISVHDTNGKNSRKTPAEGQVESARARNDSSAIGSATAPGRSFGGPIKGLAIGALAGGGYVVATNGKDVNLPALAGMVIRVDQPLSWNGTSSPMQR
jgi:hypothetical protein